MDLWERSPQLSPQRSATSQTLLPADNAPQAPLTLPCHSTLWKPNSGLLARVGDSWAPGLGQGLHFPGPGSSTLGGKGGIRSGSTPYLAQVETHTMALRAGPLTLCPSPQGQCSQP